MSELHLTLTDYQSERQWRWLLQDERGNFLGDHDVNLPADAEYDGFRDPTRYLAYHSAYRTAADSLARLGAWIGAHVFGDLRGQLAASLVPPATPVHLHVSAAAQGVLFRPLELARFANGQSFTEAGLRFIYRMAGAADPSRAAAQQPPPQTLRLLAVFSLPGRTNPLNLRRERYQLTRFVRQLSQVRNVAVELRVLQYGATRETLKQALQEAEGWDVVHLSGHGLRGELLLEDAGGNEDFISAADLTDLLRPGQQRLKLLILDACYSGAASHAAARRAVGLDDPTRADASTVEGQKQTELPSLAQDLVAGLDCAALAMRYPVGDAFATDLMLALYDKLLDKGQPLPAAL
ncbi:MAG: CHAT domain-containing protein, partial [Anaerolineales bacterium]|nr:CHAT domain-containing protein [Anaerolineales bacterium]